MPIRKVMADPRTLLVPPSRSDGADRWKLQMQTARFGGSAAGMDPPEAYETPAGELVLYNGVTRATRMAKESPGTPIPVNVVGKIKSLRISLPTIQDLLP